MLIAYILKKQVNTMFDRIKFNTTISTKKLSSKRVTEGAIKKGNYNAQALANADFSIWGSVDSFSKPPITDFALEHLYHMEDFCIFHYRIDSFTERRFFQSYLLAYTYSGSGKLIYRDKEYILSEGDGFFIHCYDYHLYKALEDSWDIAILHLGGPLLSYCHEQFMQYQSPVFHEAFSGKTQEYLEQLLALYSFPRQNRDWQVSTCIDSLLCHILNLQADAMNHSVLPETLVYLIKYMENHYDKPLTLDFLADFAGISKYYLSREFKKYTGFSPNDYLITLRINRAKSMLKNTTLPAAKIAHEVGIHDLNNFTNLFKKKTGMTPILFRNSNLIS